MTERVVAAAGEVEAYDRREQEEEDAQNALDDAPEEERDYEASLGRKRRRAERHRESSPGRSWREMRSRCLGLPNYTPTG